MLINVFVFYNNILHSSPSKQIIYSVRYWAIAIFLDYNIIIYKNVTDRNDAYYFIERLRANYVLV